MSVQAISWVIEHSRHKGNSFVVLLMIANHARSDGTGAWPSIPTIAKEARVSERTVQRTLKRLSRFQHNFKPELEMQIGKGPRGSNMYSLPGVKLSPLVSNCQSPGDTICHPPGVIAVAPEPSFNRPSEIRRVRYCSICGRTGSWHLNAKKRGKVDHEFVEAA